MKTSTLATTEKPKGRARPVSDEEKLARAAAQVVGGESTFFYSLRRRENDDAFVCAMADHYQARGYLPVAAVALSDTRHARLGEVWFVCAPGQNTRVVGVTESHGPGQ